MIEENATTYIAGYIYHTISKNHDCETCRVKLSDPNYTIRNNNIYLSQKDSDKKRYLKYASPFLIDFIKEYEYIFQENIKDIIFRSNVKSTLLKIMKSRITLSQNLCTDVKDLIIQKYVNMRIHYFIHFFNRDLGKKRARDETFQYCGEKRIRKLAKVTHE